ncbi:MAG TPA: hypothetical protein VHR45_02440 [Thermoanaerobaculia bacterium]|nr:hypothetical protein [Thermoanaerobaculia bacterium]
MKRRLLLLEAAVAVALLLAAHVFYWYAPRERPAVPEAGGAAAALLSAGGYDVCLWVPYPHQNLGALSGAVEDLPGVVAAAARLAGSTAAQEIRTFGPFAVPPAREIVACADLAGGRLQVLARVYPLLGMVARLAGRLAGNPWLAGGQVGRLQVGWRDGLWSVSGGAAPEPSTLPGRNVPRPPAGAFPQPTPSLPPPPSPPRPPLPPSLAVVRWSVADSQLPAGSYLLRREGRDLALSLVSRSTPAGIAGEAVARSADAAPPPGTVLLVVAGPREEEIWTRREPRSPLAQPELGSPLAQPEPVARTAQPAALALFETGGWRAGSFGGLPGMAVFNAPGSRRWGLPAGGIAALLGGALPAAEAAGWTVVALDRESLRQAVALAPALAALVSPTAGAPAPSADLVDPAAPASANLASPADPAKRSQAEPDAGLALGLWLEPRPALRVVARVHAFLERFPLAPRREVSRWRDWETVLAPLAACEHLDLTARRSPPTLQLRCRR